MQSTRKGELPEPLSKSAPTQSNMIKQDPVSLRASLPPQQIEPSPDKFVSSALKSAETRTLHTKETESKSKSNTQNKPPNIQPKPIPKNPPFAKQDHPPKQVRKLFSPY